MRAFLLIATLLLAAPAQAQVPPDTVRAWIDTQQHPLLDELVAFLRLPNVATDVDAIRKNAALLEAMMQRRGLSPRLLETADGKAPPAVIGEWRVPGATRTLVLYAHYDGQAVDASEWASDPWTPTWRAHSGSPPACSRTSVSRWA